jgi:DNA-binding NarL/FixJ family response regulator
VRPEVIVLDLAVSDPPGLEAIALLREALWASSPCPCSTMKDAVNEEDRLVDAGPDAPKVATCPA